MIIWTSCGRSRARSSATRAARVDIDEVVSPSDAMRRSRMPVRVAIHSSDVSTMRSSSALVITREGT